MDTMLAEIEKRQFDIKMQNIRELVERIKMTWLRDYGWLSITADIDSSLEFALSEDVMRVILDNLILNSVQQNDNMPHLQIYIEIKKQAGIYCPELKGIKERKKAVEDMIKTDHSRARDMHNYLSPNDGKYKGEFIKAYNGKCSYCGVSNDEAVS